MKTFECALAAAALLVSGAAVAEDGAKTPPGAEQVIDAMAPQKPSAEQIQAFWQYYFNGKGGGPALADAKLCLELVKEGDDRNECAREVPADGVKVGTVVSVWQAYVVPQGGRFDGVIVQSKLGEQVRDTRDVSFKTDSIRTRNWTQFRVTKAGTWTFDIKDGDQVLKTLTLTVK